MKNITNDYRKTNKPMPPRISTGELAERFQITRQQVIGLFRAKDAPKPLMHWHNNNRNCVKQNWYDKDEAIRYMARRLTKVVYMQPDECKKCGGLMKKGLAMGNTLTGTPDFADGEVVTMSYGGPGKLVECIKCTLCGHSVNE